MSATIQQQLQVGHFLDLFSCTIALDATVFQSNVLDQRIRNTDYRMFRDNAFGINATPELFDNVTVEQNEENQCQLRDNSKTSNDVVKIRCLLGWLI